MSNKSLQSGIKRILIANIINSVFNLLTNFLLPKYLSIDAYAEIKSFQLYSSYVGILHLGYSDGMYLKYGGKDINRISKDELRTDSSTMICFQIIVEALMIIVSLILNDNILLFASITILPVNMVSYYRYLLQATGEFDEYSKTLNIAVFITFSANIVLLLARVVNYSSPYIVLYIVSDILILFYCEYLLYSKGGFLRPKFKSNSISTFRSNVQNGILLMLGNSASIFLTGMDRWFIKVLMDNKAFAQYSFAVSIEGLMNILITPISTTLYNYFCTNKEYKSIDRLKNKIIMFATYIVALAFPAKFVIENFIQNYTDAIYVLFIIFAAQIYYIIVKCVYVNLYKSNKKQKIYFIKLVAILVFGFIANAALYLLNQVYESFAIGTLLSGILWLIISTYDFKHIKLKSSEIIYLVSSTCLYIFCGVRLNSIIGCVIYLAYITVFCLLNYKENYISILDNIKSNVRH